MCCVIGFTDGERVTSLGCEGVRCLCVLVCVNARVNEARVVSSGVFSLCISLNSVMFRLQHGFLIYSQFSEIKPESKAIFFFCI